LAADAKRLHLFHDMVSLRQDAVIATAEHMLVHVDAKAEKSAPAPQAMQERAQALVADQSLLPPPDAMGRQIRMPG
jgi:carnitine 3-dehydrogenase